MGFLIVMLGTSEREPENGEALASPVFRYHRTRPKDTYGDALIVPCDFMSDGQTSPKARLPAEGQPQ